MFHLLSGSAGNPEYFVQLVEDVSDAREARVAVHHLDKDAAGPPHVQAGLAIESRGGARIGKGKVFFTWLCSLLIPGEHREDGTCESFYILLNPEDSFSYS